MKRMSYSLCLSLWAALLLGACTPHPRVNPNEARDPYALVSSADALAQNGNYDEATRRYLVALDHGRENEAAFVAARRQVVKKLVNISNNYPPALAALQSRSDALSKRVLAAALNGGPTVDGMDLALFVQMGFASGREAEVRATGVTVRAHLGPDARLRVLLSGEIEKYLVVERRYADAVAESDDAVIDYYLKLFDAARQNALVQSSIAFTIDQECGAHFEALLGVGRREEAAALADKLIAYSPIASTFSSLIRHGERASPGSEEIARLRDRAQSLGLAVPQQI